MPNFTVNISKSAIHFIRKIKFETGVDESKFVHLMTKYFKNHPEELKKILHNSNTFNRRTKEIIKNIKPDSRIRQDKF